MRKELLKGAMVAGLAIAALASTANADTTPQTLPYSQNWSTTTMITTNDDWSGVPGVVGYLGDDGSTTSAPYNILSGTAVAGTGTVDVIANSTPSSSSGGVAEFDAVADPVVAIQGSGSADYPSIVIYLDTTGFESVLVSANIRDMDGSADNSIQPLDVQYRVGGTGNFASVSSTPPLIADASSGPSLATLVTPITNLALPAACNNQSLVEVRFITGNASANDEWLGIDDISITGTALTTAVIGADAVLGAWTPASAPFMAETMTDVKTLTVTPSTDTEWKVLKDRSLGFGSGNDLGRQADGGNMPGFGISGSPITYYYDTTDTTATGWLPATESLGSSASSAYTWVAVGDFQGEAGGTDWDPDSAATTMLDDGNGEDAVAADGIYTLSFIPSAGATGQIWKVISNQGASWTGEVKCGTNGWSADPGDSANYTIPDYTTSDRVTLEFNALSGRIKASVAALPANTITTTPDPADNDFGTVDAGNGPFTFDVVVDASTTTNLTAGSATTSGNFVLTGLPVSVAAGTSETLTVTWTPTNTGVAENAVFSVTTDGNPASFDITVDGNTYVETDIATARADFEAGTSTGKTYLISDVTVSSSGLNPSRNAFTVQSADDGSSTTRGLAVDDPGGIGLDGGSVPSVGDVVTLTGTLGQFRGLIQLTPTAPYSVVVRRAVPTPVTVAGADLGDNTESVLVSVPAVFFPTAGTYGSNATVLVNDTVTSFNLFFDTDAAISIPFQTGIPYPITGVGGQFDTGNPVVGGTGYQIIPRGASDIDASAKVEDWTVLEN